MIRFLALTLFLFGFSISAHAAGLEKTYTYVDADMANTSKLLFKKGILKTDDPAAVEEYIRLHHCGLYEQYGQDDFAWSRIRESQARELELALPSFPEGLEVSITLPLDRYDLETNQFMIEQRFQIENMGLVAIQDITTGSIEPVCNGVRYSGFVPRVHPLGLIAKIDTPITLKGIPMSRTAADALIQAQKDSGTDSRTVILALRLRLLGTDPLSVVTNPMRRTVLGQLDELRVYDPSRKTVLFKKDFESLRASSGKK